MKLIFSSIVVLGVYASTSAIAGGMDSGGGKGIVCFKNHDAKLKALTNNRVISDDLLPMIETVTLLDYQYAKETFSSELITDERQLQSRLSKIPKLKKFFDDEGDLTNRFMRLRNAPIHGTFDENDVALYETSNCVLTQLAIQQDINEYETIIHVDNRLTSHASFTSLNLLALKLHETTYRFLRKKYNEANSATTRELVSQLLRNNSTSVGRFIQPFVNKNIIIGHKSNGGNNEEMVIVEDIYQPLMRYEPNQKVLDRLMEITKLINASILSELLTKNWREQAALLLKEKESSSLSPNLLYVKIKSKFPGNGLILEYEKVVNDVFESYVVNQKLTPPEYLSLVEKNTFNSNAISVEKFFVEFKKLYLGQVVDVKKYNDIIDQALEVITTNVFDFKSDEHYKNLYKIYSKKLSDSDFNPYYLASEKNEMLKLHLILTLFKLKGISISFEQYNEELKTEL